MIMKLPDSIVSGPPGVIGLSGPLASYLRLDPASGAACEAPCPDAGLPALAARLRRRAAHVTAAFYGAEGGEPLRWLDALRSLGLQATVVPRRAALGNSGALCLFEGTREAGSRWRLFFVAERSHAQTGLLLPAVQHISEAARRENWRGETEILMIGQAASGRHGQLESHWKVEAARS